MFESHIELELLRREPNLTLQSLRLRLALAL
jgi:hypothetical protein